MTLESTGDSQGGDMLSVHTTVMDTCMYICPNPQKVQHPSDL